MSRFKIRDFLRATRNGKRNALKRSTFRPMLTRYDLFSSSLIRDRYLIRLGRGNFSRLEARAYQREARQVKRVIIFGHRRCKALFPWFF